MVYVSDGAVFGLGMLGLVGAVAGLLLWAAETSRPPPTRGVDLFDVPPPEVYEGPFRPLVPAVESATTNRRMVHVAGIPMHVAGHRVRQRCSWCGTLLVEYDLARVGVFGREFEWPQGVMVAVDGDVSYVIEGDQLPGDACALLDPEVTR